MIYLLAQSQSGVPISPNMVKLPGSVLNPLAITLCTHLYQCHQNHIFWKDSKQRKAHVQQQPIAWVERNAAAITLLKQKGHMLSTQLQFSTLP